MSEPVHCNVLIIGAGPGGCHASLHLSRSGIDHVMVDRSAFPRDKICGDAFSGKVVEEFSKLDLTLDMDTQALSSYGVTFVAPNGKALRVPFKVGQKTSDPAPGFISKRLEFDQLLLEEALTSPHLSFHEKVELRTFKRDGDDWICTDRSGKRGFTARYLIVADGAQSTFAKQFGGIRKDNKHYAAGIRAYYSNVKGLDKENFIELHFLKEFIPGYLWIFPLPDNQANVGIGLRSDLVRKRKLDLKKTLSELIERHPALRERFRDAELVDDVKGWGLPFGSVKRPISGERYCLIGDAASLIDPFTGEGIGNAMVSGRLAAEAIQKALDSNTAISGYDEAVYRELWPELKLSHNLQLLASRKWLFNWLINKAVSNETLSQTISSMFTDLDVREQLKRPSFYLNLLFK